MKTGSKLTAFLIVIPALLPLAGKAAITTLPVTGWNQDMIIDNGSTSYDKSITGTVDSGAGTAEGATFAEAGTYPVQPSGTATTVNGFVAGTVYTSISGSGATFQFQDFKSSNSLLLKGGVSGTLTLLTPSVMKTLALFGTSGNGKTVASVTLTFTDSTSSVYTIASGVGITADWFNSGTNTVALVVGNRESNHHEDNYATIFYQTNSTISIYESDIALTAADQAKTVSSVTIANTGTSGNLAIMAISSDATSAAPVAPKITSFSFDFTNGTVTLNFTSTAGTLYTATNSATLSGTDWAAIGLPVLATTTTSSITAPFTKTSLKNFFRIETGP